MKLIEEERFSKNTLTHSDLEEAVGSSTPENYLEL